MLLVLLFAFGLAFLHPTKASRLPSPLFTAEYPLPNQGNLQIHDPNIILYNDTFYAFKGAPGLAWYKAPAMSGPWTSLGKVLEGPSLIDKVNRKRPWAPTTIERNGTFYCFYCISQIGTRNSSIGVATSNSLEPVPWQDHGAIVNTGTGDLSNVFPYTVSDAIDPSVIIDPADGKPWLTFGSYWTNIWQVPLADDMLSVEDASAPSAHHLSVLRLPGNNNNKILPWYPLWHDPQGTRPEEGSWISYKKPYYYLWYSHGQCCSYNPLPPPGLEYVGYASIASSCQANAAR
jgi:arabinan endo-1,5-alpha-L-arabinosidase